MRVRHLLVLAAILGAAVPASASGDTLFEGEGTILAPNPSSRTVLGITETAYGCHESPDPDVPNEVAAVANGLDGVWLHLGEDVVDAARLWGKPATLVSAALGPVPNDVDAWFFDSGCALIKPAAVPGAYDMATDGAGPETGSIPSGAEWVVVDLYAGANASFTLTVTD